MAVRCERCRGKIDAGSALAIKVERVSGHILAEVVRSSSLGDDAVALHVNGDRMCSKPVTGFKKNILEAVGMTGVYDLAFLDFM